MRQAVKDGVLAGSNPSVKELCIQLLHFRIDGRSTGHTEEINRLYIKWWNVRCSVQGVAIWVWSATEFTSFVPRAHLCETAEISEFFSMGSVLSVAEKIFTHCFRDSRF